MGSYIRSEGMWFMNIQKKGIAMTPPMGWNSWDCYGASVTEEEVRGNADYMAAYLKPYGPRKGHRLSQFHLPLEH